MRIRQPASSSRSISLQSAPDDRTLPAIKILCLLWWERRGQTYSVLYWGVVALVAAWIIFIVFEMFSDLWPR